MRTGRPPRPAADRFWEKVGPHDDPTKCWLWTGATRSNSGDKLRYGQFWDGARHVYAHRLSYEMYHHVTILEGMTIDHVKERGCTSTLCVNPYHLEAVTNRDNLLRGATLAAKEVKATHCPQGHPYDDENTYVCRGRRYCRVCRRYHAKKKAQKSI